MLIINADDWGFNRNTTDRILSCYQHKRVTSASAMVFMEDSERSAEVAEISGLEVGLHLNFTDKFSCNKKFRDLDKSQQRIAAFLLQHKYCLVLYNPFLVKEFDYVYRAQYEEFIRLYKKPPAHINGHHHMHLCANVLLGNLLPGKCKVRRSFSFAPGEKHLINRFYRYLVDRRLERRFVCTDFFFSIPLVQELNRLRSIVKLARSRDVELMVHPQRQEVYNYLMSAGYMETISEAPLGTYGGL